MNLTRFQKDLILIAGFGLAGCIAACWVTDLYHWWTDWMESGVDLIGIGLEG